MPRYRLIVAYDGSRFNGFQRQTATAEMTLTKRPAVTKRKRDQREKGVAVTVQECLEYAVADAAAATDTDVTVADLHTRFAGRTDAGVHATGQVCVCSLPLQTEPLWLLRKSINSRLSDDISVESVEMCSDSFCPRSDVKQKQYSYTLKYRRLIVDDSTGTPLPICDSGPNTVRHAMDPVCLWVVPWALNDSRLSDVTKQLQGSHNFKAFVHKQDRNTRDHELTLQQVSWKIISESVEEAPVITAVMTFQATGFRRSMVRNLVGFCVDVCRGLPGVAALEWADIWSGSEEAATQIHSAPAGGLCLDRVDY